MRILVKYLMWISQKAGVSEEYIDMDENSTLEDLLLKIIEIRPSLRKTIQDALSGSAELIVLHNSVTPYNGLKTCLKEGDIVVLMPPVSGG
ncbi:MAG: MoaD family protein [Desulfurococcaceae archaeon]